MIKMRPFAWLILAIFSCNYLHAQNIETAETFLKSGQPMDAKKEIDAVMSLQKYQQNPDAFYAKAKIYNAIAWDPALSGQFAGARMTAFQALKKYTEIDDKMLAALQTDGYKPINEIYRGFYQTAANRFNSQQYKEALEEFTNAISVSTFMTQKGWINLPLDTNSVLFAGVAAEKLDRLNDAANFYGMLVDHRINKEGFAEIYKWVANYYYRNKNIAKAKHYILLGKEVYPTDPFWISLEFDIIRAEGNKEELFAYYEKIIGAEPANYLYRYHYAAELYQYGHKPDPSDRPDGSDAFIRQAEKQLLEVIRLLPSFSKAQFFEGQIIYNTGIDLLKKSRHTPPGDEKNKLEDNALQKFSDAIPYFLAVEQLPGSVAKPDPGELANRKEAYRLLIIIYDQLGQTNKSKEYESKFSALDTD